MEPSNSNFSDLPPAFDEWLRARPLQPGPQETSALLEKVRSDCHDRDFEEMLTKALRPDPTLYEPTMKIQWPGSSVPRMRNHLL